MVIIIEIMVISVGIIISIMNTKMQKAYAA